MVLSKLDLAVVVAIAGGMLWIEHGHRVSIATPTATEPADPAALACPDSDSVPFSADCMALIEAASSDPRPPAHAIGSAFGVPAGSGDQPAPAELSTPACPVDNENRPYSAKCLRFLSGWFWQANPRQDTR